MFNDYVNTEPDVVVGIFHTNVIGEEIFGTHNLFYNLSRINHSCAQNVDVFDKEVVVTSLINKGEEILMNYLGDLLLRKDRQERLQKNWRFLCCCKICSLKGDELEKNEKIREQVQECKKISGKYRISSTKDIADMEADLKNEEKWLELVKMIREEMMTRDELWGYLNCYVCSHDLLVRTGRTNNTVLHNVYKNKYNAYKEEAFEIAKRMGSAYIKVYQEVIVRIESEK